MARSAPREYCGLNMRAIHWTIAVTIWAIPVAAHPCRGARTIMLDSLKDNTLIESTCGAMSNGAGNAVRCGRTGDAGNGVRLRALVWFDVAGSLPPRSIVTQATLELHLIGSSSGPMLINTQPLSASWGEGAPAGGGGQGAPAQAGDATWVHRFFPDVAWQQVGGDFDHSVRATAYAGTIPQPIQWTSAMLADDVQDWLDKPQSNHGWLLRGVEDQPYTAKQLASREHPLPELRPRLIIEFESSPQGCIADIAPLGGDRAVDVLDLLAVINAWGPCPGPGCHADIAPPDAPDQTVDVQDLLAIIANWGPCT